MLMLSNYNIFGLCKSISVVILKFGTKIKNCCIKNIHIGIIR